MMSMLRFWSRSGGEHSFAFGANGVGATVAWHAGHEQMALILAFLAGAGLIVAIGRVRAAVGKSPSNKD